MAYRNLEVVVVVSRVVPLVNSPNANNSRTKKNCIDVISFFRCYFRLFVVSFSEHSFCNCYNLNASRCPTQRIDFLLRKGKCKRKEELITLSLSLFPGRSQLNPWLRNCRAIRCSDVETIQIRFYAEMVESLGGAEAYEFSCLLTLSLVVQQREQALLSTGVCFLLHLCL